MQAFSGPFSSSSIHFITEFCKYAYLKGPKHLKKMSCQTKTSHSHKTNQKHFSVWHYALTLHCQILTFFLPGLCTPSFSVPSLRIHFILHHQELTPTYFAWLYYQCSRGGLDFVIFVTHLPNTIQKQEDESKLLDCKNWQLEKLTSWNVGMHKALLFLTLIIDSQLRILLISTISDHIIDYYDCLIYLIIFLFVQFLSVFKIIIPIFFPYYYLIYFNLQNLVFFLDWCYWKNL